MRRETVRRLTKWLLAVVLGSETLLLIAVVLLRFLPRRGVGGSGELSPLHGGLLWTAIWIVLGTFVVLVCAAAFKKAVNPGNEGFRAGFLKFLRWLPRAPFCFVEVLLDDPAPHPPHG